MAISQDENKLKKSEYIAIVKIKNKSGVINLEGKEILPVQYENIHLLSNGLFSVKKVTDKGIEKWGYFDFQGNLIIPFNFDETSFFVQGLAPVKINNKWGYINKQGTIVIDTIFDYAEYFGNGRGRVIYNTKIGYIDSLGNFAFNSRFSYGQRFYDGFAWVNGMNNNRSLINIEGEYIFNPAINVELKFSDYGITKVSSEIGQERKFGYINTKGELIIPMLYDEGGYFFGDTITYVGKKVNGVMKYGFISSKNELITDFEFDFAKTFYNDLGVVANEFDKIDSSVIEFEGKEIVTKNGFKKFGAINSLGDLSIPLIYQDLEVANHSDESVYFDTKAVLIAQKDGKKGVIDENNNILIPFLYENIIYSGFGIFQLKIGNKNLLVDSKNKVLFESEQINVLWQIQKYPGFFNAEEKASGKWGVIDIKGNWQIKPKYEWINFFQTINAEI